MPINTNAGLSSAIGQMLLFGWMGDAAGAPTTVNDHARALIDEAHVGGIIVMGRNVDTPDRLRRTLADLQTRSVEKGRLPLFVAVDQEGGRVNRLNPPHFTRMPSAREIGDARDPFARAKPRRLSHENCRP